MTQDKNVKLSIAQDRQWTMRLINCVGIGSLYICHLKQIVHAMKHRKRRILFKGWNGQAVRKFKESTVKTTEDKNKNREGVRKSL